MKVLPKPEFEKFVYERDVVQGMKPEEAVFDAMSTAGMHLMPEDEIVVSNKTNTTKRLHEIGHKITGRPKLITEIEAQTVGDRAYQEILAQKFAYERMGRPVNYRVGKPALFALHYEENMSPKDSVDVVIDVLERVGIKVPVGGRREFLRWVKDNERVI